jgi:hypothetical protein
MPVVDASSVVPNRPAPGSEPEDNPAVIGKSGFGLNDALAVLGRKGIAVTIRSRHGTITTRPQAKVGFPDVVTLHGVVAPPDDPTMVGSEVVFDGLDDDDVAQAKAFFCGTAATRSSRRTDTARSSRARIRALPARCTSKVSVWPTSPSSCSRTTSPRPT